MNSLKNSPKKIKFLIFAVLLLGQAASGLTTFFDLGIGLTTLSKEKYLKKFNVDDITDYDSGVFSLKSGIYFGEKFNISLSMDILKRGTERLNQATNYSTNTSIRYIPLQAEIEYSFLPRTEKVNLALNMGGGVTIVNREYIFHTPFNESVRVKNGEDILPALSNGLSIYLKILNHSRMHLSYKQVYILSKPFHTFPLFGIGLKIDIEFGSGKK